MRQFSGNKMREMLETRGLSVSDLARAITRLTDQKKPSGQLVGDWLCGRRVPGANYLPYVATALNCKIDDFYEEAVN